MLLPRGFEIFKILHTKQQILLRQQKPIHKIARQLLLSGYRESGKNIKSKSVFLNKSYSTKKPEKITEPCTKAAGPITASSTKTTENTATEPKAVKSKESITAVVSAAPKSHDVADIKKETKKYELETSKGILAITTTIEDSKINDVVFEKTKKIKLKPSQATTKTADTKKSGTPANATTVTEEEYVPKPAESKLETKKAKILDLPKKVLTELSSASKSAASAVATAATPAAEAKIKPKRLKVDSNRSCLERNFITPNRAMSDFLLKPSDLETLSKIKRRSPFEQEPAITVYWLRDVEAKAISIWGSKEQLIKECIKREVERKKHQQNLFTVKRRLRDYRREIGSRTVVSDDEPGLRGKSGKVVLIAIGINGLNFIFKVGGWLYSGSHSMFSEAIHSLADTINQLILAYGIHKSTQIPDSSHPYGYTNMKYVSSLISGVGIFCVGAGLSYYHGITGLMHPEQVHNFFWAFCILGGSLVSEGATLLVAVNEIKRSAKLKGISFKEYVVSGKDPCVNVVLTEDAAAVASVAVAASCMGLTAITGSYIYDAIGSLLVGSILGAVASFIIYTNVAALVGQSIPQEQLERINFELESDIMIRAIHDVKGIDIGNFLVRYKAEMDFDGRELTRSYLDKQDLSELLKIVQSFETTEQLEEFLLKHGENIVDLMGGEIDRIEMKLRKKFPEIRHCDLEIL